MDGLNRLCFFCYIYECEALKLASLICVLILCILVRMFGAVVVSFSRTLSIPMVSFVAWNIATSTLGRVA